MHVAQPAHALRHVLPVHLLSPSHQQLQIEVQFLHVCALVRPCGFQRRLCVLGRRQAQIRLPAVSQQPTIEQRKGGDARCRAPRYSRHSRARPRPRVGQKNARVARSCSCRGARVVRKARSRAGTTAAGAVSRRVQVHALARRVGRARF